MPDLDLWEIPEYAIAAFERATTLQVTVHEVGVPLWSFLPPERFTHRSRCCAGVKVVHDWACVDFEVTRLRENIHSSPEGRYHVCHAGLMEWVVPVYFRGRLAWILFAGQAQPVGAYREIGKDIRTTGHSPDAWKHLHAVTEEESAAILESLRQLRARLVEWHEQIRSEFKDADSRGVKVPQMFANRRALILTHLHRHRAAPTPVSVLARELNLSEGRTIHLVKELFGSTYVQLVNQMRLRTAASLLRGSTLSVLEICLSSGFQDLSHFHRVFRKHFGITPLKYRESCGV